MWLRWHRHSYEAIVGERTSEQSTRWRRERLSRTVALCGAMLCTVWLWVAARRRLLGNDPLALEEEPSARLYSQKEGRRSGVGEEGSLKQVVLTNKYRSKGDSLYPWQYVAEPATETRLEIFSWPGRADGERLEYM